MNRILTQAFLSILALVVVVSPIETKAQSEELLTVTIEGTSKATGPVEAAREIQSEVTAETARSRVQDILGEKRFQKSKAIIESKIVRQAAKFIPFVKAGSPVQEPDGTWKMAVELKLSPASLRRMVLEAGLLNDAEGPAAILPVIAFVDRQKNASLRWWMGEPKDDATKFLSQVSRQFHDVLQAEFSRQGFHVIKPQSSQTSPLPEPYRAERPTNTEYQFMSDFFQAPMVIKGDVRFKEVKEPIGAGLCAIKIQIVQAQTGRTVAEVSRQLEADSTSYESALRAKLTAELPELAKDLATQVYEVWQRGTLNTNQIRLALRGTLTPKQINEFKSGLLSQMQEVKSLRERLFDGTGIHFEMDYSGESAALVDRLKGIKIQGFETRVSSTTDTLLALEVKAR